MPVFKFEDFKFDSTSHKLNHKGIKVAIRPKALKLLSLLIQNRQRILSKAEIMSSVWGSEYARDHLLFQLIGELRKPPFNNEFIRTQPNEGYQWNVTTSVINNKRLVPQLIAASVVIGLVCLSQLAVSVLNNSDINLNNSANKSADIPPTRSLQLPAYNAFSKGIIALQNGEKSKAIQWFEFALLENPDSVESSIFLAETLYQQNRPEESSQYLQKVLENENISAYNKATASNILSLISEQRGQLDDALIYAQKSSQSHVLGQCSVDFVEQRIRKLESDIAMSPIPADADLDNAEDRAEKNAKDNKPVPTHYAKQCNALKSSPLETTLCLPLNRKNELYAVRNKKPMYLIS